MWRQVLVNAALLGRVRRAMFWTLARNSLPVYAVFCLLAAIAAGLAASGGDWGLALISGVVLIVLPLAMWNATGRAARVPLGTYLAYAVTPDGTFHYSGASGTGTVSPGFVSRVGATTDCWLIYLFNGMLMVAPRETIPDADATLLVRHLPKPLKVPPAARPPL